MGTAEVERFLATHAPFAALEPEVLRQVGEGVRVKFFPAGEIVLQKSGEPSRFAYVVRTGSIELLDGERVVDVLDEGELFGHPSLLAGIEPIYGARAREDTICYLLPEELATRIFGSPTGVGFLAASLRRRLEVAEAAAGLPAADPRLTRVDTLLRPLLVCDGQESIRVAARRMAEARVSAILVRTPAGEGILTDADLRAKVVAENASADRPASDVMSFPVRAVAAERLVRDAILDMLSSGTRHLAVRDDSGAVIGVLSEMDLLGVERRDPFEIRAEIDRAENTDEVATAARRLPKAVAGLARTGLDAADVARVVAAIVDAATSRLLQLAQDALGDPPAPWAWLALGSQGRREQALSTDQDHALVWEPTQSSEAWFADLAEAVTSGLESSGIRRCPSDVMAVSPVWRRDIRTFARALEDRINRPADQDAFVTGIALDHRPVAGGFDPTAALAEIREEARRSPAFLWRITRLALEIRPPLGFRGDMVVHTIGGEEGVLDIKAGGLLPVTDLARVGALRAGVAPTGTIERLRGAGAAGGLERDAADALEEAFRVFLDIRLKHQADQIDRGDEPDNLIDPSELGRIERGRLRDAFRIVAQVQRDLSRGLSRSRFG